MRGHVYVATADGDDHRSALDRAAARIRRQLDKVPARHDETLRVYVLAKILVAFLIDSLLDQADSFSPWGYPITPAQQLANHPLSA